MNSSKRSLFFANQSHEINFNSCVNKFQHYNPEYYAACYIAAYPEIFKCFSLDLQVHGPFDWYFEHLYSSNESDWENGLLSVEQSVPITSGGIAHVKEPKTKSSRRHVSLPPAMIKELREYQAFKLEEREKVDDRWQGSDYDFVFCHPDGKAFHQERPHQWFRQFLKKHGLRPIRFHTLRHISATLLINQGVHAKIISERLGHNNIQITMNTYGHAMRTADLAAAQKFESLLTGAPKTEPPEME